MESLAPLAFGKMLKALRKRQHLTQQALADKLEVHRNTIILWEGDKPFSGTKAMVFRLAEHLGLSEEEKRQLLEASLTTVSSKWNVPYPRNPFFTGREDILETLHKCLTGDGDQDMVPTQSYALQGLSGIGKTQLAVEYTYRHELSYSAILWIGAESAESILSSFVVIAELLELPERQETDQQSIVAAVQRWLSTHSHWLLIWDNVEDLKLLQGFLPATRQGAILMTTRRQALGTLAQGIDLSPMRPEEGLLLLLRRAKIVSPQAGLEQIKEIEEQRYGEYQVAQELVAAIDGLPLALDQTGAYIEETSCSLSDYLELFQTRQVQLLRRRGEVESSHPASVVTSWSLSCEKVEQANPLALDLLRLCAYLHPEAIPEEILMQGAAFLGQQPETEAVDLFQLHEAMRTVLAYSLLRYQRGEQTYSMHRLVQVVLKNGMDKVQEEQWMEHAIHGVDAALPLVEPATWGQYERLLSHALVCTNYQVHSKQSQLELASLLFKTGSYLFERFQHEGAEPLLLRALQIREQLLAPTHLDVAHSLHSLAQLHRYRCQMEEAERLYQRVLPIFEQALTSSYPDLPTLLNNLATLYMQQGRYAEADTLFLRALHIMEQAWGPEYPHLARSLNNLAILHHIQGQLEKAEPLYRRALSIWEQVPESALPDKAIPLTNLGNLYRDQGKFAEAEQLYQRSLSIWEQMLGPAHPSIVYGLVNLLTLYAQQGKLTEAELLSQRALNAWQSSEHPLTTLSAIDVSKISHFGYLFPTIEKHCQLLLLHPYALNGLTSLYTQQG